MRADRSTSPIREHATPRRRWPGTPVATGVLLAVLLTAVLAVLTATAPAARAHDEVVGTVPAPGATVPAAPGRVELELGAPAQELGTQVLVTGPDGVPVSQGPAQLRGATVVQPLHTDLPAGTYVIEWRVTSSDGHPVTGSATFTVAAAPPVPGAAPGAATPPAETLPTDATTPAPSAPVDGTSAAAGQDAGSAPSPAWTAAGVGLLVAAAGLGARHLRRRP